MILAIHPAKDSTRAGRYNMFYGGPFHVPSPRHVYTVIYTSMGHLHRQPKQPRMNKTFLLTLREACKEQIDVVSNFDAGYRLFQCCIQAQPSFSHDERGWKQAEH